ncbi:hypothetical protein DFR24_0045 [Panacagrimonas perspica]|uniref:DUF192 domain-containing protein n=1 Tax=Panacagrimonas perspica TaxID=381431 RepID=A0A4V6Q4C4_9GAMM|nr:hypothetical protein DFR24_0045 [Panacagrimonas perspica]THD01527.1 hypothetical protein B1810_18540 [Panacagrimonas perspica]
MVARAYDQEGQLIFTRVFLPSTFLQRLRGLLGRKAPYLRDAWWFKPCSAIHTFGMRFPIDVLHLSREGRILRISAAVPPSRISICAAGHQVVELREGAAAALRLEVGNRLEVRR